MRSFFVVVTICFASLFAAAPAAEPFRVRPYLQHPTPDAITVCWLSNADEPGTVTVETSTGPLRYESTPHLAESLGYNPFGEEPHGPHPAPPYQHKVRISGLETGTAYRYSVRQSEAEYTDVLHTAPDRDTPIRFILYADSETEPESTNTPVDWPAGKNSNRPTGITKYLADQTTGYRENLKVIDSRKPNFVSVVGDLVEAGGEQRDWDEFWKHNAGEYNTLAGHIPLFAALGNHENFGGPGSFGGYSDAAADYGCGKYLTYFEFPSNGAANPHHVGRYYRVDYGPITLITVDSSDGQPHGSAADTNHNLHGSHAADFNPGSPQYAWLELQLAEAQRVSRFTFVQYHHTAYGSGPHSVPFGQKSHSGQSGIAMRVLQPLFLRYGVDAVFSGHDEMLERSVVHGDEVLPHGGSRLQEIHYYDVGIGGDGLRGPGEGFDNPYRKFLAHDDSPEVWSGLQLVSGGKHYGHLEVNITPGLEGRWLAKMTPVYVFPVTDDAGHVVRWERRTYDDVVTLQQR